MEVIIKDKSEIEQAIIQCNIITKDIMQAVSLLQGKDGFAIGYINDTIHHIPLKEILYFEAVDNRVFFNTKENSYEIKNKLYEIEANFRNLGFLRVSKAFIINLHKIKYLSPAFNGRLEATLVNAENIIISRQYVKTLKQILQMK